MFDGIENQELPPTPPSSSSSRDRGSTGEGEGGSPQQDTRLPTSLPPTPSSSRPASQGTPSLPSDNEEHGGEEEGELPEQMASATSSSASSASPLAPPTARSTSLASSAAPSTPSQELTEVEQRAVLAVEQYQDDVRTTLLSHALQDSSSHVALTVKELIEDHHKSVDQLHGENGVLRGQLQKATSLIEQLSNRLAAVKQLETSWQSAKDTRDKSGSGESEELGKEGAGTPALHAHDGVLHTPSPSAVAALLADYHRAHGVVATLEGEQQRWKAHFADLAQLLSTVAEENARYRQELAVLKTTTVSLTQFQEMAQAKERATYELGILRLETAKLAEQLDLELQLRELTEAESGMPSAAAGIDDNGRVVANSTQGPSHHRPDGEGNEEEEGQFSTAAPPRHHVGMWAEALREVEEQAALAATHAATRTRLAEVEAKMKALATDNATLTTALAALKEEDELLRQDAQSLTYRNGVLSQQVASLLVKCETLRRALKTRHHHPPDPNGGDGDDAGEAGEGEGQGREGNASRRAHPSPASAAAEQRTSLSPSLSHPLSSSSSSSVQPLDAARTASIASTLNQKRSLLGASATLLPHATSNQTLLSSRTLDVTFLPPAQQQQQSSQQLTTASLLPQVEVERGVRRGLSTYSSSRRRSVALRNFGGGRMDLEMPCEPRLPASDQLSGVPLGRPSAYSVLDPVHGTVRRHHSSAELTLVRSSSGQRKDGLPMTSTVISEIGEEENRSFLDMLDMVEADDKLDRFSVNSVAELVVRNQELARQLYDVTQRLERAETSLARPQRPNSATSAQAGAGKSIVMPRDANHQDTMDDDSDGLVHSSADSEAGRPTEAVAGSSTTPSQPEEEKGEAVGSSSSSSGAFTTRISTTVAPHQRSRLPEEEADLASSQSECIITSQGPQPRHGEEEDDGSLNRMRRAPWANVVLGPQVLAQSVQDSVKQLIGAVLEQHDATVARVDEGLSASLLQLLATKAISSAGTAQQRRASLVSDAGNSLLQSLTSLCTAQAVTLAQQAVTIAVSDKSSRADVYRKGWEQAQQVLRQATQEFILLLHGTAGNGANLVSTSAQGEAHEGASSSAVALAVGDPNVPALGADDGLLGDPVNLTHMMSLLETAAAKEATIQRVHTVAQARQRAFLAKKERKLAKLTTRTEHAAAVLTSLLAQQQQQQQQRAATTTAAAAGAAFAARPSASPMLQPMEPAVVVDSGSHGNSGMSPPPAMLSSASPMPSAMVLGTPTMAAAPAAAASTTTTATTTGGVTSAIDPLLLPGVRAEGTGVVISQNPYLVVTDDSAEDDADDDNVFADLKDQLALAQAQSSRLAQELHEEKASHIELYERMWRLELERDTAFKEREDVVAAMSDMLSRDAYERVIADLDEANSGIADREAQLAHAQEENSKLLTQIDLLQEQLSSHQQRHELAVAATREKMALQGRELEEQNRRYSRLYAQNRRLEEEAEELRRDAEIGASIAADNAQTIDGLAHQLAEVKEQFLSGDGTQATLLALYPGDTVLAANAALVRDLRRGKEEMERKLHEMTLRARDAESALADGNSQLRRAIQQRQAAEVRLQEVLLRQASAPDRPRRRPRTNEEDDGSADGGDARSDELQAVGGGSDRSLADSSKSDGSDGRSSRAHSGDENSDDALAVVGDGVADGSETAVQTRTAAATQRQHLRLLAELQATVESQERDIALLHEAERAWKEREADLRRQLDLLGRDPISETARKYGLTACESFEAQVKELSDIHEALQENIDGLLQDKAALEAKGSRLEDKLRETEGQVEDLRAELGSVKAELAAKEEALADSRREIADLGARNVAGVAELHKRESELQAVKSSLDSCQRRLQDMESSLQQCRADREKFFNDNRALISRVEDLQRDLTRSDEEKRAANAALTQGMMMASAVSHGGGRARGSLTARRHLRTAGAFTPMGTQAAAPPSGATNAPSTFTAQGSGSGHGSSSLTADWSMTATPHLRGGSSGGASP